MSARKRLLGNMLSLGAVQFFSYLLPFLSLPYLARVLGAADLGRMAIALSIAQIFVVLTDYGFNLSAPQAIALVRHDRGKVTDIWCAVTMLRTLFAVLGALLLVGLTPLITVLRDSWDLIAIAYLLVIGNVLFPQWLFQGLEQLRLVSIVQIAARLLVFGGIFLLVHKPEDLRLATALQSVGPLLGGLLALPHTLRTVSRDSLRLPTLGMLRHQVHDGWHIFLSTAAINIYTSCNAFLLGLLAPPNAVGHYHVAEKMIRAVQMTLSPISNAVYPHVTRLASENRLAALQFNRKLLTALGSGACLIGIIVFATAPWAVQALFGPSFSEAAALLRIMAFLPLLIAVSNVLGIQTMLPFGMKRAFSRVLLASALLDLILFLPAAKWFGAAGAAWTNVLVELFVTLAMAWALERADTNPFTQRNTRCSSQ
jgi:polysaccharide transporter, PST family